MNCVRSTFYIAKNQNVKKWSLFLYQIAIGLNSATISAKHEHRICMLIILHPSTTCSVIIAFARLRSLSFLTLYPPTLRRILSWGKLQNHEKTPHNPSQCQFHNTPSEKRGCPNNPLRFCARNKNNHTFFYYQEYWEFSMANKQLLITHTCMATNYMTTSLRLLYSLKINFSIDLKFTCDWFCETY